MKRKNLNWALQFRTNPDKKGRIYTLTETSHNFPVCSWPAQLILPSFLRDTTESDRKRKRAQEDKYKMGEGENRKEEGTMKDGDGREPEAKKKKQSKIDTSSDSDDDEDDEDDDDEASVQMWRSSCLLQSVMVFFFPS